MNNTLTSLTPPHLMPKEEQIEVFKKIKFLKAWMASIEKYMNEQARNGEEYEGLELRDGKKHRKFKDEKVALRELSQKFGFDKVAKHSLLTLKALDANVGAEALEPYIEMAQYAPQLQVKE